MGVSSPSPNSSRAPRPVQFTITLSESAASSPGAANARTTIRPPASSKSRMSARR
jgi:hypothetical protein